MTDLQRWMAEKGIKQRSLAKTLGVSQPTISRWRQGKGVPSPEQAERLELLSGIPAWNFLRPQSGEPEDELVNEERSVLPHENAVATF